jgi:hypothetical protein
MRTTENCIKHNTLVKVYPDGSRSVLVASRQIFREAGWERADQWEKPPRQLSIEKVESDDAKLRAQRRARSAVRDLALANPMRYFITLTLNKECIDRYDAATIIPRLQVWLDNMVRRHGLKYILVPEHHKDGAIHFHGFINDALRVVDSGVKQNGRQIFNLPQWKFGFTTAIELYGDYNAAVGYVCKYIAKEQEKIGGRWYYSGGGLARPSVEYTDTNMPDGIPTFESATLQGVALAQYKIDKDGVVTK